MFIFDEKKKILITRVFWCSLKFSPSLAWPYTQYHCSLVQPDTSFSLQDFPDPSFVIYRTPKCNNLHGQPVFYLLHPP